MKIHSVLFTIGLMSLLLNPAIASTESDFVVISGIKGEHQLSSTETIFTENAEEKIIFSTPAPIWTGDDEGNNPPIGLNGLDLFNDVSSSAASQTEPSNLELISQKAAIRFIPADNVELTNISLWLMSNAQPQSQFHPAVEISLRENVDLENNMDIPAEEIIHAWTIPAIQALGWVPELDTLNVEADKIKLQKGKTYWLVAESPADTGNPIWTFSRHESENDSAYISHRTHAIITDEQGNVKERDEWLSGFGNAVGVEIKAKLINDVE